jgi:hypothetical protein
MKAEDYTRLLKEEEDRKARLLLEDKKFRLKPYW